MGVRRIRRVVSKLGEVVHEGQLTYGRGVDTAERAAQMLSGVIGSEAQEVFAALILDSRHRVTGYVEISRGTLSASLVHPREVFGPALRMGAAAILVSHNHPSGDSTPSAEDRDVTIRLVAAGTLLGVPVLDHIVLGDGEHTSIRASDPGIWP